MRMKRLRYHSVVLMVAVTSASRAQTFPAVHVSIQQLPISSEVPNTWLQQVITKLDQTKLRPIVSGSWEGQIVDTDKESGRLILHRGLRAATGYYTFPDLTGDTLVARWDNSNAGGLEKAIWLWDRPASIAFVLQVDPLLLSSAAFVQYCENLVLWDTNPIKLTSLRLYFPAAAGSQRRVIGKGAHAEQELGLFGWWFEGISDHGEAYVVVGASKPFLVTSIRMRHWFPNDFHP
jgi:hypothetical protein